MQKEECGMAQSGTAGAQREENQIEVNCGDTNSLRERWSNVCGKEEKLTSKIPFPLAPFIMLPFPGTSF